MPHTATHSHPANSKHSGRLARRSADPDAPLFAYGSLQFPEVLAVLLGRIPPLTPVRAEGRQAIALPDVVYPGLIAASGTVTGVTVAELMAEDWHVIDAFEDDIYELQLVHLCDGRRAWSYTCTSTHEPTPSLWDRRAFAEQHLAEYLKRCASWRQRHAQTPITERQTPRIA